MKMLLAITLLVCQNFQFIFSSPGGSSLGGVLELEKSGNESEYAFHFDEESYMDTMINFFKYQQFLNRIETKTNKTNFRSHT